jgi:superfamily II DNA or RNA helicase
LGVFPDESEIKQAADLLVNRYKVSAQLLGQLFGSEQRNQANDIVQQLGGNRLTTLDVAKLLIFRKGSELFSGRHESVRKLRQCLLTKLPDTTIVQLFEQYGDKDRQIKSPSRMSKPLAEKKWHTGGPWARDFVKALEFPQIFAGMVQGDSSPTTEDIQPLLVPPKLVDFQVSLKEKMLEVLERDGDRTRCVVTLPTGGGKTRVAVEAFIDWMQPRFSSGKYLVWIAQSEELCEQAIKCIQQMWSSREFISSLRIYRYFGGRNIDLDKLQGGAVVTSIQQLHNRIKSCDEALDTILKDTGAMIIDEAHRAVTKMYDVLLERAEEICGADLFPICGLTATPGRSGINRQDEIPKLVGRFEAYLIKPDLGDKYSENPLLYFRENRYLAHAHHIVYRSGIEYKLSEAEIEEISIDDDFPPGFLKRLAKDVKRNLLIIKRLLQLPQGTPTLIYACTVEHAEFLSAILTAKGRHAGAISSSTPLTIRRGLIQDFKEGQFDFLCNYGVLTTGFDAPKTKCIVICRPTTSVVLYEQIIGRGLRGLKFGGTEQCDIIDFADNIGQLGRPLAYARFLDFWTKEDKEGDSSKQGDKVN